MIHFIPAWYQEKKWCENEQKWYRGRSRTEFDDTVKQIQLFHRNKVYPFQVFLLSFAPNFRHFLHRQGVYRIAYWSCFDAIQEVSKKKAMLLSFHNLNWPKGIEFIYTPFVVMAMLDGKKYAQIEFGEAGNLIQVDMYKDEVINRRNLYDDRGFVSSTILFENGKQVYQDYLTEKGIWKIRHYIEGHVEVNPKTPTYTLEYQGKIEKKKFIFPVYNSLDEILLEVVSNYISLLEKDDLFSIAMDNQHNELLYQVLKDKKPILSFFENRCEIERGGVVQSLIESSGYVVADQVEQVEKIKSLFPERKSNIKQISLFDTRLDFGISQQVHGQKIMLPVDGMKEKNFENLIFRLGNYLNKNKDAQIHLFTRKSDYNREMQLLQKTRMYLEKYGMNVEWAAQGNGRKVEENHIDPMSQKRFFVEQCVEDYKVSNCMREQRILVDLREASEVYLQILAISMGIPQLASKESQFIHSGKNGFIVKKDEDLEWYLNYYLVGLANWNQSMIHCYEIGKQYSAGILVENWKEVIDCVRKN